MNFATDEEEQNGVRRDDDQTRDKEGTQTNGAAGNVAAAKVSFL